MGKSLAQGHSAAVVVRERTPSQFQARGFSIRHSCLVTGGACGHRYLSLSPSDCLSGGTAEASLGSLPPDPAALLACISLYVSVDVAPNHGGCCLKLAAFGSMLLPGSLRLNLSQCNEHRTGNVCFYQQCLTPGMTLQVGGFQSSCLFDQHFIRTMHSRFFTGLLRESSSRGQEAKCAVKEPTKSG